MKNKKISKKELIRRVVNLENELKRKPKKRDNGSLNYYARKLFGSWNILMKAAGYKVRFYQEINSIRFNKDFAYFLGLLITDGHVVCNDDLGKYQLAIYTSYLEEREMLLSLIKELFDYKAGVSQRIYGFNKSPNFEIRITSKNLVKIIINDYDIPSGPKSLNCIVPRKIKNSNTKIKSAFLRGVIDGDGSILKRSVKIASGSIKFLEGIKEILGQLNIYSGKIIKDNKETNTFAIRICRSEDLVKIKAIYNSKYLYKRKKDIINKI